MKAKWNNDAPPTLLLRMIDPDLSFRLPSRMPRLVESLVHRLRLNVPFGQAFLHKIGVVPSSECLTCGDTEDTVHILLDCARFQRSRDVLRQALDSLDNRPFDVIKVLGVWPKTQQSSALRCLLDYLEDVTAIAVF